MEKKRKFSLTTQYTLILCVLLLVANVALGSILLFQSKSAMKTLIDGNMIYISSTAASSLDGEFISELTEDDIGSEDHQKALDALTVFQDNFRINEVDDLECIYVVRKIADDNFVYIIDPDPVEPAYFGQESVISDALISASNGRSAVDDDAVEDEWGRFYTAYSPVFDIKGQVVGIVGVDFNAEWYETQLTKHTSSIVIASILSLTVGALLMFILTGRIRKRFNKLNNELSALAADVGDLANEIIPKSAYAGAPEIGANDPAAASEMTKDPVADIDSKVRGMRSRVGAYLELMHEKAYVDLMSGTGNRSAYTERAEQIDKSIAEGAALFSLAVVDINGLKETNDVFGHDCGDLLIINTARILKETFDPACVFRIGGDEFTVVVEGLSEFEMTKALETVKKMAAQTVVTEEHKDLKLSLSTGAAEFTEGRDGDLRSVFVRADEAMYADKRAYYSSMGDRRHPR